MIQGIANKEFPENGLTIHCFDYCAFKGYWNKETVYGC